MKRSLYTILFRLFFVLLLFQSHANIHSQIAQRSSPSAIENYAAKELQRYYYQLSGQLLNIDTVSEVSANSQFILVTIDDPLIQSWLQQGLIKLNSTLEDQSYIIKTITRDGNLIILIAGATPTGLLYGVYGLLEDHFGIRFYMSGDVFPENEYYKNLSTIDDERTPQMTTRGFLPWTNFPQSATIYSWNDWKYIIDQAAKMRMNFILIHNYNAFGAHNEMFHNFEYKNHLSRGWMATIKTGHGWSCPPWDINEYRFGASEIYDDYDFGADYGLHNETLTNKQIQDKGSTIFQKVIDYAHQRAVKIGLGLDIDVILPEYKTNAYDEEIIKSQVKEISTRYPNLDYLFCFQSESKKDSTFYAKWNTAFDGFYTQMKSNSPSTRIAVAGWGLTPESVAQLPKDVICAPISHYSATFENGKVYGDREYWGCPWLERDFNSSQYYYPYNVNLSQTIECYKQASLNTKGFYALTWRLTDAISPKLWYISKAPWYDNEQLDSSEKIYRDYAIANYGREGADELTAIINENEPFATDFAECVTTPKFNQMIYSYPLLNISLVSLIANSSNKTDIIATNYSQKQGTQNAPCSEGEECVGYILPGNWLKYDNINFDKDITELSVRIASASSGGIVTVSIDSLNGKVIAEVEVKNTEGWQAWKTLTTKLTTQISGTHNLYVSFSNFDAIANNKKLADTQLATIDKYIATATNAVQEQSLVHLRKRIEGTGLHIDLNAEFEKYKWEDYPGKLYDWARSFLYRIDDISSYGNIMSTQNRFVQENYIFKLDSLKRYQQIKSPSNIVAKGTKKGAVINWKNEEPAIDHFIIYRNKKEIARTKGSETIAYDLFDGEVSYSVRAVDTDGNISVYGIPDKCFAGNADNEKPIIIVTSPIASIAKGQKLPIKISVVENRHHHEIVGTLYYRKLGTQKWTTIPFKHRVRATFTAQVPTDELSVHDALEYYIEVSDGKNISVYPASAPNLNNTVIITPMQGKVLGKPNIKLIDNRIVWSSNTLASMYRIYRSKNSKFDCDATSFVTFVSGNTKGFKDNGFDFDGLLLKGSYYYKITTVDDFDNESEASAMIHINY